MMQRIKKLLGPKTVLFVGLVYTIFLTFLMLSPAKGIPISLKASDKIAHVIVFSILTFLWLLFFHLKFTLLKLVTWRILAFVFFYGIVIELLQGVIIESRTADGWDIVANAVGILVGWFVFQKFRNLIDLKY